jgi:hypothetical protein
MRSKLVPRCRTVIDEGEGLYLLNRSSDEGRDEQLMDFYPSFFHFLRRIELTKDHLTGLQR